MKFFCKIPLLILFTTVIIINLNNLVFANNNERKSIQNALVLMSDFGLADGAVSAMKGVAFGVDNNLKIFDITHAIPEYDIWAASYRLYQVIEFWSQGTVFVSIIDPGVGTKRTSIVAKSKNGQYFVNPNNGILTLIAETVGIAEIREIDETKNRLPKSYDSYTFHGRDVYVYTGARLASGAISYESVGRVLPITDLVSLPYQKPTKQGNNLKGMIPVLDVNYGNVWTNIPKKLFEELNPKVGDKFEVRFYNNNQLVTTLTVPYYSTFGDVKTGEPIIYLNSLLELSIALNMDNFAKKHNIASGLNWTVEIFPIK